MRRCGATLLMLLLALPVSAQPPTVTDLDALLQLLAEHDARTRIETTAGHDALRLQIAELSAALATASEQITKLEQIQAEPYAPNRVWQITQASILIGGVVAAIIAAVKGTTRTPESQNQ